ncbi:lactosylceramide 4-alpha-galactosyltransferase-like isoform X2 [Chironomus tepperi]|uniref:lactosylceramide 4-alpha-galactosyltransferase-like isoform X2 n=1 Tax=Chironomus tepperi TaxID=113505 RepID=UPI00391F771B
MDGYWICLYLDLDVITIEPLKNIEHKNFACLEENRKRFQSINGAVLRVSDEKGRELIHMLIDGVIKIYDSRKHWDIGPRLVTKVLREYCEIESLFNSTKCENFDILPIERCYAIEGYQWYKFYRESDTDLVLKSTKDSYYVHLWNYQSSKKKISKSKNVAFNVLASKYCPLVYESNTEL